MVDLAEAVAGWLISWMIIIGIPACAVALTRRVFPNSRFMKTLALWCGIGLMCAAVVQIPDVPAGSDWVAEHKFLFAYFKGTFEGISSAVATVLGIWSLIRRVTSPKPSTPPAT